MPRQLTSFPPELLLHVADFADQGSLCSLLRTSKFLHFLLWPTLYKREIARRDPVGFIRCIRLGAVTAVSKFIAVGADVDAKIETRDCEDFAGFTHPIATAVVRNQREIVCLLLQQGAEVGIKIDAYLTHTVLADHIHPWAGAPFHTPLTVAVAMGHDDIAVELTRNLVAPNPALSAVFLTDQTALEQAARCLRPAVVRQLLKRGANPNTRQAGNDTLLHTLLEDMNLRSYIGSLDDGETRFHEVISTLLEHGADPFIKRTCNEHPGNLSVLEQCRTACRLTACSIAASSPYRDIQQHFLGLEHRQQCKTLACRGSRHRYASKSEDIAGHCLLV